MYLPIMSTTLNVLLYSRSPFHEWMNECTAHKRKNEWEKVIKEENMF